MAKLGNVHLLWDQQISHETPAVILVLCSKGDMPKDVFTNSTVKYLVKNPDRSHLCSIQSLQKEHRPRGGIQPKACREGSRDGDFKAVGGPLDPAAHACSDGNFAAGTHCDPTPPSSSC